MKRVNTLYRVSTKGQVDQTKDDIPMQRISCRGFIERMPDWVLNQEYEEKGISGFKVSAEKRDAVLCSSARIPPVTSRLIFICIPTERCEVGSRQRKNSLRWLFFL